MADWRPAPFEGGEYDDGVVVPLPPPPSVANGRIIIAGARSAAFALKLVNSMQWPRSATREDGGTRRRGPINLCRIIIQTATYDYLI